MDFFTATVKTTYYLLYEPDLEWLRSNAAILNLERAEQIRDASRENSRKAIVYAAGKLYRSASTHTDGHYILPTPRCSTRKVVDTRRRAVTKGFGNLY